MVIEEKEVFKYFVRLYGCKERKCLRDCFFCDEKMKNIVMEVRKKMVFFGYVWCRMRFEGYIMLI